jgi:hypothetical protein
MKTGYYLIAISALIALVGYFSGSLYGLYSTPEPIVEEIPPVIIQVDNVGCVIAEVPVITYYVATDTARVTIECDSDLLFNYLPAVE